MSHAGLTAPFNYDVPVSPETFDRGTGNKGRSPYFSPEHVDWFLEQQSRTESGAVKLGSVSLTAQGASISATPVPMPALTAGLYRVSYAARISRAGSVSSSLTITMGWTRVTVPLTQAGAAMTGNTTATQQNATLFVNSDANASITYATTYVDGGGALSMQYELSVVCEKLPD